MRWQRLVGFVSPSAPPSRSRPSRTAVAAISRFVAGALAAAIVTGAGSASAARLLEVAVLDQDVVVVHLADGEVVHDEGGAGEVVTRYLPELDTAAATNSTSWTLASADDPAYGSGGLHPASCSRKTKLNGHAQMEWTGSDFRYESTFEHWIYLTLPESLAQGASYTVYIDPAVNSDTGSSAFTFDVFSSRSEAIHVNLVGYPTDAPHKAADLYHWMGDGGARSYSSFEGNTVWVVDADTGVATPAGNVSFWMAQGSDVGWDDQTGSDVWAVDFSSFTTPGTYRLAVEGVGCSPEFEIAEDVLADPFRVSLRGYFYMRIGESNPEEIDPPPRTPLFLPGVDPPATTVYLTTMHPWHPEWDTFSSGDQWDRPGDWAAYRVAGHPTNPDAWGGHSDAADWDRHLAHVVNIYDMLLPFLLTGGAPGDDDTGITESGNGIPDLLDEARWEVDFWLRLRDGAGYSHGLTNPDGSHQLYQAGTTAIAAWANAVNAAMLAEAFRLAGLTSLAARYQNEAVAAYTHADGLADPMLDDGLSLDDGLLRGRDLKMTAAALLYSLTGDTSWEDVVAAESVCAGGPADLMNSNHHQLWATAAYLRTARPVHHPALFDAMQAAVVAEAMSSEAGLVASRPSRRGTDQTPSYWRTAQNMGRTLVAHAVSDDPAERDVLLEALLLEAAWGLGRNPLNLVEMTTASTPLAGKRSVTEAYTSGRDDGFAGVHPGHTPYFNLVDWAPGMVMGRPSALYEDSHPGNVPSTWPAGETTYPSRWVWAHAEFTPRQTMRGKMALYAYLHGLAAAPPPTEPLLSVTVSSVAGGAGTVSSSPGGVACPADCSGSFTQGAEVTLTATPESGSVFAGWDGACFGAASTCELTMTANRTVTATFEPEGLVWELDVTTLGDGTGEVVSEPAGIACGADCTEQYLQGTTVELVPEAGSGSVFAGWSGACTGTGSCTVAMASDRSVAATFRARVQPEAMIYDDALATGWQDWSWSATVDLAGTSPPRAGSLAVVNATLEGWGGFSPATVTEAVDTFGYHALRFWVHGGSGPDTQLVVYSEGSGGQSSSVEFVTRSAAWTEVEVPLSELGSPPEVSRLSFHNPGPDALATVSFDHIRLVPEGIFADGFESGSLQAWSP